MLACSIECNVNVSQITTLCEVLGVNFVTKNLFLYIYIHIYIKCYTYRYCGRDSFLKTLHLLYMRVEAAVYLICSIALDLGKGFTFRKTSDGDRWRWL